MSCYSIAEKVAEQRMEEKLFDFPRILTLLFVGFCFVVVVIKSQCKHSCLFHECHFTLTRES